MLSFCKEAVAVVQPQASLLAGTIASGAPPHASRPVARSSRADATSSAARSSRADSTAAALCGVTSQRSVFTVAQVVAAVLAEAHPLGDAPAADAEERAAAAAALVDRFDLRVCDDDGSVDPDFPPIDCSVSLTSVGASVFVLCDSNTDVPLLQLAVPEEQDAGPYAAAAGAASDGRPVDSPSSLAAQAERAHMSPVAGAPSHGNREDGGGGGGDGGDGGRLGASSGDGEPAWLHVTCRPPTLRALARATSAGQRAPSGSRAPPSPSPFAAQTEPFTVRVRLQPALGGPP